MGDLAAAEQSLGCLQGLTDRVVRLEDMDAGKQWNVIKVQPSLTDGMRHFDAVGLAKLEVIRAMASTSASLA